MTRSGFEQRRLQQVIDDYRRKGYEVIVEPGPGGVPEWLEGFRPDVVALRDDDHVVVEVKSHGDLMETEGLSDLARVVDDREGWRLEVVLARPPRKKRERDESPLVSPSHVVQYDSAARDLLSRDLVVPAFILAWTAFEIAYRHALDRAGVDPHLGHSASVLKTLLSLGFLSGVEEVRSLERLWRLRNAVVHGYVEGEAEARVDDVAYLLSMAHELLDRPDSSRAGR